MIRKFAVLFVLAPLSLAQAQDKNPSFNLANKSQQAIREVFVTPAGDTNWGQNRLTSGPIAPGASSAVRRKVDGNCVFDIRVVYADSKREERRMVNTCAAEDIAFPATSAVAKAAGDPAFQLINHDKQAIAELNANPVGKPRSANLLENGALPSGASMAIKPAKGDSCTYELRVVFADKSAKTRTLDICKTPEIVVP